MNKITSLNILSDLLEEHHASNVYYHIVQIGCGGNGSYICQQLTQLLKIFNKRAYYILADADVTEEKNLNNQLFLASDVGIKKATVLAERYGLHYEIDMGTYEIEFVESLETLSSLFDSSLLSPNRNEVVFPILIGSVDNNFTRKIMHEYFLKQPNLMYLDVGCEAAVVPQDNRPPEKWTKEEVIQYLDSGYTGQVVCGLRLDGDTILDSVASVYEEILTDTDEIAPSELSCQNIVSKEPQRLITNRMAAMSIYPYLNELFETGTVSNHITHFHSKKGFMRSVPISI